MKRAANGKLAAHLPLPLPAHAPQRRFKKKKKKLKIFCFIQSFVLFCQPNIWLLF